MKTKKWSYGGFGSDFLFSNLIFIDLLKYEISVRTSAWYFVNQISIQAVFWVNMSLCEAYCFLSKISQGGAKDDSSCQWGLRYARWNHF